MKPCALNQMKPCKALGWMVYSRFYQKFCHMLGDDIVHVVVGIIDGTRPPDAFNRTNIVLIPKVKKPSNFKVSSYQSM